MSTELTKTQPTEQSILEIISSVSKDPNVNVEVMQKLVDLQFVVMEKEQQVELNKALARLEPKLETLMKSKAGAVTKDKQVKFYYTPYEEIDAMLRPALRDCGLSLSFSSRTIGDKTYFVATVQEITKGGQREAVIPYAPDTSDQLNQPQKIASGLSYAKRISVAMLFNLVFKGEDDNAQFAGAITALQAGTLDRLLAERDVDRPAFMKFIEKECGVSEITLIPARSFAEIESKLKQKPLRKHDSN
ncbi:MAG: ERF family protein [Patescibacteria group bacterium]|nr:ERF family protein [Patescibacteria group bacterium]